MPFQRCYLQGGISLAKSKITATPDILPCEDDTANEGRIKVGVHGQCLY